ncbi:hypothetical protein J5N97_015502 [Dioscorea zingiberensis]|uniref:Ribosomal protein L7Ae/L30e/S12e/Gadd45 domain-containing protein n=1 Tax=Dioscorea zingiberensis TaxID=325984 RepID=A0A9D5HKT0_9LILI|nr:hypothetical protein J5N97_015502 [Dioscorea zingiberensis]
MSEGRHVVPVGQSLAARVHSEGMAKCWDSLMELKSCTGEVILFFLNGETYLGPSCCRAIRVIEHHCWAAEAMLAALGFTPEEGDALRGFCDANSTSSSSSPSPPPSPATRALKDSERASMGNKKKKSRAELKDATKIPEQEISNIFEKDRLDNLMAKIMRSIELAKEQKGPLPEKIWMKQQFAIGVNDVTRVLERMPHGILGVQSTAKPIDGPLRRAPLVPLQAVIVASDCNPRWLIKHIPSLASSRQVPVISIKDSKRGSLRLGELVNLKTALAIGVKAKESKINEVMDAILSGDDVVLLEDDSKMA